MKYTSLDLVNGYFVLYDDSDEIICYFDGYYDLIKHCNYKLCDLVRRFNDSLSNNIRFRIFGSTYTLYFYLEL